MTMQGVSFKFDPQAGIDSLKQQAVDTVKTAATDSVMSLLMGDCDTSKSVAGKAATVADKAKTAADMEQQRQVCSAAVNSLIQLVQTGQLDISQFQNILEGQILKSITDNNAKAQTVQDQITDLAGQNDDLKAQIQELNGGSLDGVELDDSSQGDSSQSGDVTSTQSDSSGSPSVKNGGEKTQSKSKNKSTTDTKSTNPNADKIKDLIDKYNKNQGLISGLQAEVTQISQEQATNVSTGQSMQNDIKTKKQDLTSNVQSTGQNLFQSIGNAIRKLFGAGKAKQLGHQASNTTMGTTDATAATVATAKAAAAAGASVLSFGATAGDATMWAEKAMKASISGGVRVGNVGLSIGNMAALATGETTIGNLVADQLTQVVNNQISGVITNLANETLGKDIAGMVSPELIKNMQIQNPESGESMA